MTIKGKRTGSIPQLPPDRAASLHGGGWVDRSLPEAAIDSVLDEFGIEADRAGFKGYLGFHVGLYRSMERDAKEKPTVEEEAKLMDEMLRITHELTHRLENLPPESDFHFHEVGWERHGSNFSTYKLQMQTQLEELGALIVLTERRLEAGRAGGGRPKKVNRNSFVSSIYSWLKANNGDLNETKVIDAIMRICEILKVEMPEDPNDVRKLIKGLKARK